MSREYPFGIAELGLRVRDNLPYALADIDFGTHCERTELILPLDPLKQAVYLLLFAKNTEKLQDSLLFRITEYPQSFMGLMEHQSINQIIHELREAYENKQHSREKVSITIPLRGGEKWYATKNPTYEGSKPIDIYVIHATPKYNLAKRFEEILEKHEAIIMIEDKGKKDLENQISAYVCDLENLI